MIIPNIIECKQLLTMLEEYDCDSSKGLETFDSLDFFVRNPSIRNPANIICIIVHTAIFSQKNAEEKSKDVNRAIKFLENNIDKIFNPEENAVQISQAHRPLQRTIGNLTQKEIIFDAELARKIISLNINMLNTWAEKKLLEGVTSNDVEEMKIALYKLNRCGTLGMKSRASTSSQISSEHFDGLMKLVVNFSEVVKQSSQNNLHLTADQFATFIQFISINFNSKNPALPKRFTDEFHDALSHLLVLTEAHVQLKGISLLEWSKWATNSSDLVVREDMKFRFEQDTMIAIVNQSIDVLRSQPPKMQKNCEYSLYLRRITVSISEMLTQYQMKSVQETHLCPDLVRALNTFFTLLPRFCRLVDVHTTCELLTLASQIASENNFTLHPYEAMKTFDENNTWSEFVSTILYNYKHRESEENTSRQDLTDRRDAMSLLIGLIHEMLSHGIVTEYESEQWIYDLIDLNVKDTALRKSASNKGKFLDFHNFNEKTVGIVLKAWYGREFHSHGTNCDIHFISGRGNTSADEKMIEGIDPILNKTTTLNPIKAKIFETFEMMNNSVDRRYIPLEFTYLIEGGNVNTGVIFVARTENGRKLVAECNAKIRNGEVKACHRTNSNGSNDSVSQWRGPTGNPFLIKRPMHQHVVIQHNHNNTKKFKYSIG